MQFALNQGDKDKLQHISRLENRTLSGQVRAIVSQAINRYAEDNNLVWDEDKKAFVREQV